MERKTKGKILQDNIRLSQSGHFFFFFLLGRNHTLSPCYSDIKIKKNISKCKCKRVKTLPELLYIRNDYFLLGKEFFLISFA